MNSSKSSIDQFQKLYKDRALIAEKWKQEKGKAFGYLYSHVPEELLHAAGILPVQLLEAVGAIVKAHRHFPSFICYQVRGNLELVLSGNYDYLDGIVMAHSCDPLRKLFGVMKNNRKKEFYYFLPMPLKGGEDTWRYYREELALFRNALEKYTGRRIKDEEIRSSMAIYNKNRSMVRELYRLRKVGPPAISGSDILDVLKTGLVVPREVHNDLLEGLLQALSRENRKGSDRKRRIFVSLISLNDRPLMEIIEELGGEVVLDDLAMGARYHWEPVSENGDPLEALSRRYVGLIPFAGRYPMETRAKTLVELCKDYQVAGAIIKTERYCDPYLYELPLMEERFKESGIPVLSLDVEDIVAEAGRVRTRVQAFLETLE
jgi:benzoyl-CoA reductase subunit C